MTDPSPYYQPVDPNDLDAVDPATREVDGKTEVDPDADPALIDSADADRLAAGDEDEQ